MTLQMRREETKVKQKLEIGRRDDALLLQKGRHPFGITVYKHPVSNNLR